MTRNPSQDFRISEHLFGFGTVSRKMALTRAEELEIINGGWLHQVTASDFEQARQMLTGEPGQPPQTAASGSKPEVFLSPLPPQKIKAV